MKPWILIATLFICFIVDGIFRGRITTDPLPGTPVIANSLVDSAPATALVLNNVSDLDHRWNEIRSIDPIAQLQDAMLESVAFAPDRIPVLAGESTEPTSPGGRGVSTIPDGNTNRIRGHVPEGHVPVGDQ